MLEQPCGVGHARGGARSVLLVEHELLDKLLLAQAVWKVHAVAQRDHRANRLAAHPKRRDDRGVHGRGEGRHGADRIIRAGVLDTEREVLRKSLPGPAALERLRCVGEDPQLLAARRFPVRNRGHVQRAVVEIGDADYAAVPDEIGDALRDPLSGAPAGLLHPTLSSPLPG